MKETSFSTFSLSVAIFMSFFSFKAALSSEAYPIKKNTIADTEELIKILEAEIEALEKMKITYEEVKNKDNNRQRFEQTFRNKILLSHDVISKQGEIFNSKLNSEFKAKEISKDSLTSKETRHLKYRSSWGLKDNAYTRCLTEHAWACKPYICGGWDSDDCCEYQSCCECMCLTSLKAVYTPIFPIVLLSQGTVFLISSPFIIKKHPARYEQRIEKADVAAVIDDLLGDAKWMKKCLEEVNEQEKPALIVAAVAVEEAQGLEEVVVEAPANEEIEREM